MINVAIKDVKIGTLIDVKVTIEQPVKTEPDVPTTDSQSGALVRYSDFDAEGYPHTLTYAPKDTSTKVPDKFMGAGHQYAYHNYLSRIENIIQPEWIDTWGEMGLNASTRVSYISNWDNMIEFGSACFYSNGTVVGKKNYGLKVDHLPPNIQKIGSTCFRSVGNPEQPTWTALPNSITYIGSEAFAYINSSTKVLLVDCLPAQLSYLGNSAFYNNGFTIFQTESLHVPANLTYFGASALCGAAMEVKRIIFDGTPPDKFTNNVSGISPNALAGVLSALSELYVPWAEGKFTTEPFGCKNANLTIYRYTDWSDSDDGVPIIAGTTCFRHDGKIYKATSSGTLNKWNESWFKDVEVDS